jgi:predicted membrane protein
MENQTQNPETTPRRPYRQTDSWKSIFAIAVFALVITAIFDQPSVYSSSTEGFKDVAIMTKSRRTEPAVFRGGEATAVMGGADIDLRDAVMEGNQATLQLSTVMGGTKIRVPESWTVVSNVDAVLGEIKNWTHRPDRETHRLVLKGSVVMGELKITN